MNRYALLVYILFALFLLTFSPVVIIQGSNLEMDLTNAVVVVPENPTRVESKAIDMLLDEVEKRTMLRWKVQHAWPEDSVPVIVIAQTEIIPSIAKPYSEFFESHKPLTLGEEGYRIVTLSSSNASALLMAGHDERGVLFGCGRLLRELVMSPPHVGLEHPLDINTVPAYSLRGHQLGYRPKTNSYDGWTISMWEQYLRDLVVFGANAVELIPPHSDDAATSPHFPLPQMDMMIRMSQLLDDYGLDVWVWYPAIDGDYSNPAVVESSLKDWSDVLSKLPRLDAVFVPGGDPGGTPPALLMELLKKQHENLRRVHPNVEMWVSTQGFHKPWMDEFLNFLQESHPTWLKGIVFGPQNFIGLPELRERVPKEYPIRRYPDITHNLRCQYAVQDWDAAYAFTEHRESINPRPRAMARIFRLWDQLAIGFLSYSEGCNDDVNKMIWSALGWDPDTDVLDILRQYSRYFIGKTYEDSYAQGLLALEKNWEGPLLTNGNVYTTLQQFQTMEKTASPQLLLNWRFQQALYRAYYDAYTRKHLFYETQLEEKAMDTLRRANEFGSFIAMDDAEETLNRAVLERPALDWRSRVFELAEALYQSIRMQLSVPRYKAIHVERGANLDLIDAPLNNRPWLIDQFEKIRSISNENERLHAIVQMVNWTNPGPGGFYDDLGDLAHQPHLLRGKGYELDPEFRESPWIGFDELPRARMSWIRFAETRYETPLQLQYIGLDPDARYHVKAVYSGEREYHGVVKIRLEADGKEIHPFIVKPYPIIPLEFDIPRECTQDGALTLSWFQNTDRTGAGRGCQVAEVWLFPVQE